MIAIVESAVRGWVRAVRRRLSGRVRTPVYLQQEAADCGAACLGIVLAHYGRWVPLEALRGSCAVGRDGCTAADVVRAADTYGISSTGWRQSLSDLRKLRLPAILFWEFNHFVVLEGFSRRGYRVNDPAVGHRVVDEEAFSESFTGVALELEPTTRFRRGGRRPGALRLLWPWLRRFKPALLAATLAGLLLAVPGLALPLLLSAFVDHVLAGAQDRWASALIGGMVISGVAIYLLTWLQRRLLRKLAVRLTIEQSDRYFVRLLRLPMRFFLQRHAGDLVERARLIGLVAQTSTAQIVTLAIEFVMSIAFLALMFVFHAWLAALVAAMGLACVVLVRLLSRHRTDLNHRLGREQGKLAGVGMAGLRRIESLRATATEDDFFSKWSGYQARELGARQDFAELGHVVAALPLLFTLLGAAVVFGLGGWQVMSGTMSVGTLIALHVLAGNFLQPVGRLAQLTDVVQTLEAELARLNDVFDAPIDESRDAPATEAPGRIVSVGGRMRLAGRVEMRDLTFGYTTHRPPLIEGFNLVIEPGQRVSVVGPSGSGKSTLSLLAAGVYRPWSGEILFDGRPRHEIPPEVLADSVSIVSQHTMLFAATVRENLTMWNPTVPEESLVAAARDAQIHEEIIARPLGYDSMVEEGGRNFSGGQRLRLDIARSLVSNPSVLILDEATSSLDTVNEFLVDEALRHRGCACLIIAHRLSTIRDSDRILVLDRGRVVQEGTHDELIAVEDGLYRGFLHAG